MRAPIVAERFCLTDYLSILKVAKDQVLGVNPLRVKKLLHNSRLKMSRREAQMRVEMLWRRV